MKNNTQTVFSSFPVFALLLVIVFFMVSCGSSTNEQRQQEIRDSIKLEQDRKELLERANKLLESDGKTGKKEDDSTPENQ
jgi:hypothetical protein